MQDTSSLQYTIGCNVRPVSVLRGEKLKPHCATEPNPVDPAWILDLQGIGSILNPLAGKFLEGTRKKGKGAKTGVSHDWRSYYLSQYDWLKGSNMTKVVWLPNETD